MGSLSKKWKIAGAALNEPRSWLVTINFDMGCFFIVKLFFFQIEEVHQTWMICFNLFHATQCTCCCRSFTLPETNKQKPLKMGASWKFGNSELGKTTIFEGRTVSFRECKDRSWYNSDPNGYPWIHWFLGPVWTGLGVRFVGEEDGFEDSKTRKFQPLKSFGDELKALFFLGGWLLFCKPLSNLSGLKVESPNCHEIQHSGRQTSQASKFQSTVRWGWTLGKLLMFLAMLSWQGGPQFSTYKIGVMQPL